MKSKGKWYFLGAANRTTIAEKFITENNYLHLGIDFIAIEKLSSVAPPIADFLSVENGPDFDSDGIFDFFKTKLESGLDISFIPFMDSACRALALHNFKNFSGYFGTPSSVQLSDKKWIMEFSKRHGLPFTDFTGLSSEVIIKPRFGYGSRELIKVGIHSEDIGRYIADDNFVVQDFLTGPEVSIDAYFFKDGNYSAIARERLRIEAGEVVETKTRDLKLIEHEFLNKLSKESNIIGPINIQTIGVDSKILEVNPRFSGGSTASIAAGWNAPRWLLLEYVKEQYPNNVVKYDHVHVVRSRRDHVRRLM